MSCSGIDDDCTPYGLPPLPNDNKMETWNGRDVRILDKSHGLIGKGVEIPTLPDQPTDSSFYQRNFEDLTHEDLSEDEEIVCDESEWVLLQGLAYIGANYSEDLSVEEILARRGMQFDTQQGEYVDCKSWIKKVGHQIEKKCRKTCHRTKKFIEEHKKEILIGASILIGGAVIGAVAAALISAKVGAEIVATSIIIAAKVVDDISSKKEEEENNRRISITGPDPQRDLFPPLGKSSQYVPRIQSNSDNPVEQFFDKLLKPQPLPNPYKGMYRLEKADTPKHPPHSTPPIPRTEVPPSSPYTPPLPPQGNSNAAKQFFENLLKPTPAPHSGIYKLDEGHKNTTPVPTPQPSPQIEAPSSSEPAAFNSPFGTYLNNLHQSQINPDFQPNMGRSSEPIFSTPPVRSSAEHVSPAGKLDAFVETIRQSLQTIGRGMSESELLEFDSPTDPLNSSAVKQLEGIQIKSAFSNFVETLAGGSETFTRGILAPDITNYQAPPPVEPSRLYKTEGINIEGMCITFVNGMNNTYEFAKSNAEHIRTLTPNNMSINGIYSETHGPILDGLETVFLNYAGSSPTTVNLLQSTWTEFHEKNLDRPHAKILHICHSRGGPDTCNALEGLSKKIQDRVIVISIASAKYVPEEICYKALNYASVKDIVPLTDWILGSLYASALSEKDQAERLNTIWENQRKIIRLEPDEEASIFDHEFQSKTYAQAIKNQIEKYISQNGEYE